MFDHSVKVPRLYKNAAKVAKQVKEDGASLKDKVYQVKHSNTKGLYALITTLLTKSHILDYIIRNTQILIHENRLDPWLARVLITELLWGKKRLPNENKPCQTILNYHNKLTDCLATFTDDPSSTQESNKVKIKKPRYVRVNTLKLTTTEVINIFRDEGWILLRCGDNSDYGSFLATVASLGHDQFIIDMHVKDLLIFPPNTQFFQHHLYINGDIILQDKASCLASMILSPEPKSSVLDMCSAPGMKANHLAAIIGKEGTVYAVERNLRRYETLVKLMDGMNTNNVKCYNKDVLTVKNQDFPNIEYILVDPSCSGSGMLDRPEFEHPESKFDESRLQSLAAFQITILRHALYNFPKAKRVLYSTCSVNPEENESVVEQVITTVKDFKLVDLRKTMKPNWFNFGSKDFKNIGERCLYARSEQDYTNGFFVALFERLNDGETNEFFVKRIKRSSECDNEGNKELNDEAPHSKKKKNKFDKHTTEAKEVDENTSGETKTKKRKKSKHNQSSEVERTSECDNEGNKEISDEAPYSKKKKNKSDKNTTQAKENVDENTSEETKPKKKKKSKKSESSNVDKNISKKTKKDKMPKNNEISLSDIDATQEISDKVNVEKKQKSKKNLPNEQCENEIFTENKKRKKKETKEGSIKKKKSKLPE